MLKRGFDIFFSLFGLILLSPLLLFISIIIKLGSKGSVIYVQQRVGKNNKNFNLLKFRTMKVDSERKGLLTIGKNDSRITSTGYFLRKYKLDELPQLLNVIKGEMSFVGPRPEVRKYVDMYNKEQKKILEVRPGITDIASIKYRNESELLNGSTDPEKYYIIALMPDKINMNIAYIKDSSLFKDIKVILKTLLAILK